MLRKAKKDNRICIRLQPRTVFLLKRLGYIDGRNVTIGGYGRLSEFINNCILRSFPTDGEIEQDWNKFLIRESYKKIDDLNSDIIVYTNRLQKISVEKENEPETKSIQ